MPTVEVSFSPLPAHVRTARLIATAVARRAGVPEEFLDEVRLAVGEACSRAVGLHQRHATTDAVKLELTDEQDRFTVAVVDKGPSGADLNGGDLELIDPQALAAPAAVDAGYETSPELLPPGFGLAVISGLVDDLSVTHDAEGTRVQMSWPAHDPMAPHPDGDG